VGQIVMKRMLGASFTLCSCLAGQLQLASLAQADGFGEPCSDVGRISHNAPGNPAGDRLLVCDGPTHTWFILPGLPEGIEHHDAGTACGGNLWALSQDNNYLLVCNNGLWVNGSSVP
jgi:hypothetical protein